MVIRSRNATGEHMFALHEHTFGGSAEAQGGMYMYMWFAVFSFLWRGSWEGAARGLLAVWG